MTVKEIANIVDRDERTVRNWIYDAATKTAGLLDKMAESTPKKPADFTEKEVFVILKAGMGEKVAAVYMYNAQVANHFSSLPCTKDDMTTFVTEIVLSFLPNLVDRFEKLIDKKVSNLVPTENSTLEKRILKLENKVSEKETTIPSKEEHKEEQYFLREKSNSSKEELSIDSTSYFRKTPHLIFSSKKGKCYVEGVFRVGKKYTEHDRVCIKYFKDKIVLSKSDLGFRLCIQDHRRKSKLLRFKHTLTQKEKEILKIKFSSTDKIILNGVENGDEVIFSFQNKSATPQLKQGNPLST